MKGLEREWQKTDSWKMAKIRSSFLKKGTRWREIGSVTTSGQDDGTEFTMSLTIEFVFDSLDFVVLVDEPDRRRSRKELRRGDGSLATAESHSLDSKYD